MPETPFGSAAVAVSGDGSVIAGYGNSQFAPDKEAVKWVNGNIESLGFLESGSYSYANDVSADGKVIVGFSNSADGAGFAVRWENGQIERLTHLGTLGSRANGVSGDGSVIVGQYYPGNKSQAFVWTKEDGMQSLEYILATRYGLIISGWELQEAAAISDDGTTIVGYGRNPDKLSRGFMAVITPCLNSLSGDINGDCNVNMEDFSDLASQWMADKSAD